MSGIAGKRGPGRPKGSPNKVTRDIRQAVLDAAAEVGENGEGSGGLKGFIKRLALEKPEAVATLLGKILPTQAQITGEDGGPITYEFVTGIVRDEPTND